MRSSASPQFAPLRNTLDPSDHKLGAAHSKRLHRKQAAAYLGVSLSWLDKARLTGLGPPYIAIGGRVLYDSRDLETFLQSNRHSSTSEQY
jgi:hypothetical protein